MAATKRDIFYRLLAAYQDPDVSDAVKTRISDMVKQHPHVIPDEALATVQQLQLTEMDTFLSADPATWNDDQDQLWRHMVHALKVWDDLPDGDVPQQ